MPKKETGPDNPLQDTRFYSPWEKEYFHLDELEAGFLVNNRYVIHQLIGRGGFGVVFSAEDRVLRAEVALKFLHPGITRDPVRFRRVRREINLSRQIVDPRIVRIFSLESWRSLHFLVMERVRGRSLADYLEEKAPIAWEEFAPTFRALLSGVGVLHRHGIIHRDLKPSNIFLQNDAVKILDFGTAKELSDSENTAELGEIVGSPRWMSPEQIRGEKAGIASDIYQLGMILYTALSGHSPFPSGATTLEVLMQQVGRPIQPLEQSTGLPGSIAEAVNRALEKKPGWRFPDVESMAAALRNRRLKGFRFPRWLRRRRVPAALAVLVLLSAGAWWMRPLRLSRVESGKHQVIARNALGLPLWQRELSPMNIFHASAISLDHSQSELWKMIPQGSRGVQVVAVPPTNKAFPEAYSLGSVDADSRLLFLDGKGRLLSDTSFFKAFRLDEHGYSRRFYPYRFQETDLNGDGRKEQVIFIRQSQGMFPSALVFLHDGSFSVFTSPGVIVQYRVMSRHEDGATLLLLAMANPVGHMTYLARVRVRVRGGVQVAAALPRSHPGAFDTDVKHQVILPTEARIRRVSPRGTVILNDSLSGTRLEWNPHRGLSVKDRQDKIHHYSDSPMTTNLALSGLQRAYRISLLGSDSNRAREEVEKALDLPLTNPFLRSALWYWKGHLHLESASFKQARNCLEKALALDAFNMDAACRMCELAFLEGKFGDAVRMAAMRFDSHYMFWGLSNGRRLFELWVQLQRGAFRAARKMVKSLFFDKPGMAEVYSGLVDLFSGDYPAAAAAFEKVSRYPPNLFTVAEFRLFYARAMVASGRNLQRAKFFLKDLETHSLRQGWRAGLLLAWLDARAGERSAALGNRAREAWDLIQRRSQGDFQARLWLFLDAWCYGRTMEALGNRQAAREGYRACVRANPHSGAAADARIRLERRRGSPVSQ